MSRVPPHSPGGPETPGADELEHLEELGDDAIIAQQTAAHAPQPRAQVLEEARSVVISEHPPSVPSDQRPTPARGSRKRSERTEQTVIIRDRRALEEMRKQIAKRKPRSKRKSKDSGLVLWIVVGVAAFVMGGVVALLATRSRDERGAPEERVEVAPAAPSARAAEPEPPSVSIDELPVEGARKKRRKQD